jgi:hypothetical protein
MWGNSARPARIFGISAHAFFPFMALALDWSLTTLLIAMAGLVFFIVLERFKYTPKTFFRAATMYFASPVRRKRRTILYNKLNKRA